MTQEARDSAREYTEAEQQRLALNLLRVSGQIHRGELVDRAPSLELLCWIHEQLFAGVRDHAGRIRRTGFGSSHLTFGPNRSVENAEVPDQLFDLFKELQTALLSFDNNPNAPNFEHSALHLAAYVHAEAIRIHPFEDGNGRSTRALLNWILVRVGLRPIAFDVVKQEYLNCLNHYYGKKDIQPLIDLCIRLSSGG